jgi:hypothetical protein
MNKTNYFAFLIWFVRGSKIKKTEVRAAQRIYF